MNFIGVLYEECAVSGARAASYRHISLRVGTDKPYVFATGNPLVDYVTAILVFVKLCGPDASVSELSSVDHFAFDGGVSLDYERATPEEHAAAMVNAKAWLAANRPDVVI